MDLQALGYDDWFASHASTMIQEGQSVARVMTVDRGAFLVRDENGDTTAELSGKFRIAIESSSELPCVGDWVCVDHALSRLAIIHAVLPRKSFLRRKTPEKAEEFQMIATNLDVAFIVQSCHYDFNVERLGRYLVAAKEGDVDPIIILSKIDLVSSKKLDEMVAMIRDADISARILPISNTTGSGLEKLREFLLPGKTFCLLGSSGVGKTTIINRLNGCDLLETKPVSGTGEGVHTTSRRQVHILENGAMLVDTPGMRDFCITNANDSVEESFPEVNELSFNCRFSNCTHVQEPGCAILAAIKTGAIAEDRYHGYQKLAQEVESRERAYIDKQRNGKGAGRFVKPVKKYGKH